MKMMKTFLPQFNIWGNTVISNSRFLAKIQMKTFIPNAVRSHHMQRAAKLADLDNVTQQIKLWLCEIMHILNKLIILQQLQRRIFLEANLLEKAYKQCFYFLVSPHSYHRSESTTWVLLAWFLLYSHKINSPILC